MGRIPNVATEWPQRQVSTSWPFRRITLGRVILLPIGLFDQLPVDKYCSLLVGERAGDNVTLHNTSFNFQHTNVLFPTRRLEEREKVRKKGGRMQEKARGERRGGREGNSGESETYRQRGRRDKKERWHPEFPSSGAMSTHPPRQGRQLRF